MCETCGCTLKTRVLTISTFAKSTLTKSALKAPNRPLQAGEVLSPRQPSENQHSHAVLHNIMSRNDEQAQRNRDRFSDNTLVCINIMSSPGSGKTTLLETTLQHLKNNFRIAVIEGDLETDNDATRIRAQGVEAIQITTGSACHLDAHYIAEAMSQLNLAELDLLFIENVGNLVCPAAFDLGQHANIALLSTTEGDDKPLKYPVLFQKIDGLVISKIELLDFFDDFSEIDAIENFRKLANNSPVWPLSAKTGRGISDWIAWLLCLLNDRPTRPIKTFNPEPLSSEGATQ
ncbi:hydrogenase nickel incorporation protein HypB [Teredinibacter purpureus]|uniref:hydrogenase nickel incorporation protein HypB n=1 Tax=Teredinibacter purpureus TaxID=2731756 RepID=UPI0005F7809B|nr:hydrogenase nickel incorporation protein HypB [Teredinibacter purpureus]